MSILENMKSMLEGGKRRRRASSRRTHKRRNHSRRYHKRGGSVHMEHEGGMNELSHMEHELRDMEGGKRRRRGSRTHKRKHTKTSRKHRRSSRKGGNLTSAVLPFGLLGLQKVFHNTRKSNKTRKVSRRNRRR